MNLLALLPILVVLVLLIWRKMAAHPAMPQLGGVIIPEGDSSSKARSQDEAVQKIEELVTPIAVKLQST
jgi:hypothetical protein